MNDEEFQASLGRFQSILRTRLDAVVPKAVLPDTSDPIFKLPDPVNIEKIWTEECEKVGIAEEDRLAVDAAWPWQQNGSGWPGGEWGSRVDFQLWFGFAPFPTSGFGISGLNWGGEWSFIALENDDQGISIIGAVPSVAPRAKYIALQELIRTDGQCLGGIEVVMPAVPSEVTVRGLYPLEYVVDLLVAYFNIASTK
ncbi:hypothetical protein N8I71_04795 [Roseibacterium sp. SDUM158016]|uniref:hypothetical protein n=1 Tax=Roseicyclus sediminis TaxID=2980997 RepID=UPI0021CFB098|nr:hypothetical protein [Roseibacterium sp. SDUM158016]MCU4652134.1 hypothetical protein [Roseibacterium sp. SDUM158016]